MHESSKLIKSVGERIRLLRKQRRMTILNLANLCLISEKHLGQIERGKSNVSLDLLERIACALNVEPYLLIICDTETLDDDKIMKLNIEIIQNQKDIYKSIWNSIKEADNKLLQRIYRVIVACQD